MNNTFLLNSNERKVEFDYFEIEKIDSERVFLVNISSTFSDYIDVEINNPENELLVNLEAPIHAVDLPTKVLHTNMEFTLPESINVEDYYLNKNGTNIFLIFHKKPIAC